MASYKVKCILVMPSLGHIFAGAENIIQVCNGSASTHTPCPINLPGPQCWEVSTSEKLGKYHGHDQRVTCLREEVDTQLISASDDGTLRRCGGSFVTCLQIVSLCDFLPSQRIVNCVAGGIARNSTVQMFTKCASILSLPSNAWMAMPTVQRGIVTSVQCACPGTSLWPRLAPHDSFLSGVSI